MGESVPSEGAVRDEAEEHLTVRYPQTRTVDVVEQVAGLHLADPYRWLEDDTEEVRQWQKQQAELASSYVRAWPHYSRLHELVERCTTKQSRSMPRYVAGRWFRSHTPLGSSYPQVVVSAEPFGEGRVLVDLADYQVGEDLPVLSWLSPSPDGRVLAFGVCTDGSEHNAIRLIDTATSQPIDGAPARLLHEGWTGGAVWLPDSSGFYYLGLIGGAHDFRQGVFLHCLGEREATAPEPIPLPEGPDWTVVQISRDGRWAVAAHRILTPVPVAIRDLTDPASKWQPFITEIDGTVAGHVVGDRYIAITDVEAPRGRLVAIPLDSPDPNDSTKWTELIPASECVLRTVTPVADQLYVAELEDTYAKVRIVDLNGRQAGTVPLPAKGALAEHPFPLMALVPRGHPDEFVFLFSTLTSSWAVHRYRSGAAGTETLQAPEVKLDAVVDDFWATSADGTRIPYHVVRPASADPAKALPALLSAYGGFNAPFFPWYPSAMAAFVAAGGAFVHAHLRGGSEFGRTWWEAGRLSNKENCFADLYAVAEDLAARGITSASRLAMTGVSNGGLLAGVALTQRPELWRAVIPRAPLLDLIGALRDPYSANAVGLEYADPDDPAAVSRLCGYSPYHLVRDHASYPAVYLDAGDADPRCPPWHARKLAARLQAAQSGSSPILLHVWEKAGHGSGTHKAVALEQDTHMLAFAFMMLEMSPA